MDFVQVGRFFINATQVTHVIVSESETTLYFSSTDVNKAAHREPLLILHEADAAKFQEWLHGKSTVL